MKLQYGHLVGSIFTVCIWMMHAGGDCMEEASPSVQLLLRPKGHRSHPNVPVLLRRDPTVCHGPRSQHPCLGNVLHSHCHHYHDSHQESLVKWPVFPLTDRLQMERISLASYALVNLACLLMMPLVIFRARQVYPSGANMDPVRERHVHAPNARGADGAAGDHVRGRVGGHREGGRSCEGQARGPSPYTGEANRVRREVCKRSSSSKV